MNIRYGSHTIKNILLVHKRVIVIASALFILLSGATGVFVLSRLDVEAPLIDAITERVKGTEPPAINGDGSHPEGADKMTGNPAGGDASKLGGAPSAASSPQQTTKQSGTTRPSTGGVNRGTPSTPTKPTNPGTNPTPAPIPTRDPFKQPFDTRSIWNMPIGSGASYIPAGLSGRPAGDEWADMPQVDPERIVLRPTAPMTPIYYNSVGWSGGNRCVSMGQSLVSVPMPHDLVVASTRNNEGAAFLMPDRRTIVQTQPFARCSVGGIATSWVKFPNVDIYGDGITGAHGGSRMSSIGGSLRVDEMRPGGQGPRHALKVNVDSARDLFRCTKEADCFRWPSQTSDSGAVGIYGSVNNNQNYAMRMGSLLAIPANRSIASLSLESEPGRQLAWTLQNYGAYIVDSTGGPGFALSAEDGPDGSFTRQFQADYGVAFEQRVRDNSAWARDVRRLVEALHVINNNSPSTIGGGGQPRQPLAPAIHP